MSHPLLGQVKAWLKDHESELLADTVKMLQFPSIESDAEPNAPYGAANRQALDFALDRANAFGMKTTDLEGHLGFAEFGTGDKLIMSLGHLDVVPVGAGWKHPPFGAEIDGEYIYGRGTTDDKGPTMASFYAMRAIKEAWPNAPIRFRQAFGCDEESGFGCVEQYMKTEETPTFGVAPDSGWPLYHAEKGIANIEIDVDLPSGPFRLTRAEGGQRPNIVIDSFQAEVHVDSEFADEVKAKLADSWDKNVSFSWQGQTLLVSATGKAAHGSTPFAGDSAAIRVFRFLNEISPTQSQTFYNELFSLTAAGGAGLGIAGWDEVSEDLTSNLGVVASDAAQLHLLFNIRYPVTWTGEMLRKKCAKKVSTLSTPFHAAVTSDSPPLYFPLDHPMVKIITDVYAEETGERKEPGTMGGGTYARAVPNTVSIGTCWEGDGYAHETDERIKVAHLYRSSQIYAHIFLELAAYALANSVD